MSTTYSPNAVWHQPVPILADGDQASAANFNLAPKAVADRTAYLKRIVEDTGVQRIHAGPIFPPTPNNNDLFFLTMAANEEVALFIFRENSNIEPDGTMVYAPEGYEVGRWLHVGYTARGRWSGLASLDAETKIPNSELRLGQANGPASLDAGGKVPDAQLGRGAANGVASLDASAKVVEEPASKAAANGIASLNSSSKVVQDPASKGLANGVASLDANGRVPEAQLRRKWGVATANGSGGASATGSEAFTVTPGTVTMEVVFETPMPNADYVVTATPDGGAYFGTLVVIGPKTVNGFMVYPWNTATAAAVNTTINHYNFGFIVTG